MSPTEDRLKLICSQRADEIEEQLAILREHLGPEADELSVPIKALVEYLRSVSSVE